LSRCLFCRYYLHLVGMDMNGRDMFTPNDLIIGIYVLAVVIGVETCIILSLILRCGSFGKSFGFTALIVKT
jgi:hypothetical protein